MRSRLQTLYSHPAAQPFIEQNRDALRGLTGVGSKVPGRALALVVAIAENRHEDVASLRLELVGFRGNVVESALRHAAAYDEGQGASRNVVSLDAWRNVRTEVGAKGEDAEIPVGRRPAPAAFANNLR